MCFGSRSSTSAFRRGGSAIFVFSWFVVFSRIVSAATCRTSNGSWLAKKRFRKTAVDRDDVTGGLGALVAEQPHDGVGAVSRQDRPPRKRALRVEIRKPGPQVLG